MPLNVRKFGALWFLLLSFVGGAFAQAQMTPSNNTPPATPPTPTGATNAAPPVVTAPAVSAADLMRERVMKAKALIAIKSFNAAIYELEGIRRETNEPTVNNVVQVILMNCYLEQSDYRRAQALLTELFNAQKTSKPNANYFAVAAQVVKGAKTQLERYKTLGLAVSDKKLPADAVNDINRMRETIETVITQSKVLAENKKQSPDSLALLEEASNARINLARDDYDAKLWKEAVADARDDLMNSRSVVNAVDDLAIQNPNTLAANTTPLVQKTVQSTPVNQPNQAAMIPVSDTSVNPSTAAASNQPKAETPKQEAVEQAKIAGALNDQTPSTSKENDQTAKEQNSVSNNQPSSRVRRVGNGDSQTAETAASDNKAAVPADAAAKSNAPLAVGSLLEYATEKINPTYPPAAKTMRMTGTVRVEVIVNEDGKVAEVQNTSGPVMLKGAATDAVKRWKFRPFTKDGQPTKATGYLSFNFNL